MKFIIAPDSFKESMDSPEVAKAIKVGILKALPSAEIEMLPVGDGGEGTLSALITSTRGSFATLPTLDPLGKDITSQYGVLGDEETCVIEMASSSGLSLIGENERNPLAATSFGTGQLIRHALDSGYRKFIVGLGGSATNDAGAGMLQALGLKLLNDRNEEIGFGGAELENISAIDDSDFDSRIQESQFIIAADVTSPFVGPNGASYVFGRQKGAKDDEIEYLDKNLEHFADIIFDFNGKYIHDKEGAGAAGGIGGAFHAFFPSEFRRGIDVVLEHIDFRKKVESADLVITGEGKVDGQTSYGKTPMGVAQAASEKNVSTIIIAGALEGNLSELYKHGVISLYSIVNSPMTLEEAMTNVQILVTDTAEQITRTLLFKEMR